MRSDVHEYTCTLNVGGMIIGLALMGCRYIAFAFDYRTIRGISRIAGRIVDNSKT